MEGTQRFRHSGKILTWNNSGKTAIAEKRGKMETRLDCCRAGTIDLQHGTNLIFYFQMFRQNAMTYDLNSKNACVQKSFNSC